MNRLPRFLGILSLMTLFSATSTAEDSLLFITAFRPGEEGAIHAVAINHETGRLTRRNRFDDVEHPFFLALSPNQKFLYSIHGKTFGGKENEQVAAYCIGEQGALELINRQSSMGTASCYLDVDATGKSLLVANYTSGSVASFPLREDGGVEEAKSFVQHEGSSVNPKRQKEPHAHCFVIGPNNRFAYAADLGLDKILAYRLDAKTGSLQPNSQPFVRTIAGAGPRHLTFHPNGKHIYVINELFNSITRFDFEPQTGVLTQRQTLSTLPDDFQGVTHCADLKITPDGKFLYGTNRGHDSLAAYRLAENGDMALIDIYPSRGKGPQNLAIVGDGKWLVCANMPGNNVVVFRIDPKSGTLTEVGQPLEIPMPSCIMNVIK